MKILKCLSSGIEALPRMFGLVAACTLFAAAPQTMALDSDDSLNILSFNIRYNNPQDGLDAWPKRKHNVSALIQFHQADLIGLQEALPDQLQDLEQSLSDYRWFGVGRDDGKHKGEHTAIVYRFDKLALLDQGTFWCSPTPDKPSKGWDSSLNRTATWGRFQQRSTGSEFLLLNTHFDHKGSEARAECAKLIRKKIDTLSKSASLPVVITGDFNTPPSSKPYETMTTNDQYSTPFYDAGEVSSSGRYGPKGTHTSFDITATERTPIDYIFVNDRVTVNRFGVLSDSFDGRLPSDHYPLLVDLTLEKGSSLVNTAQSNN